MKQKHNNLHGFIDFFFFNANFYVYFSCSKYNTIDLFPQYHISNSVHYDISLMQYHTISHA